MYIRDAVVMLFTVFFAAKALRHPRIGMLAFIGYGIISPQGLAWYFAREFPHSMVIGLATLVGFVMRPGSVKFPMTREVMLLAAIWIWFGFSTAFSYEPESAWPKFGMVSKILFMIFVSMAIFQTKADLYLALKVIALSIGFWAIKGTIFFIATKGEGTVEGVPGSFLFANNTMGLALAMSLPLLVHLFRLETNKWMKRLILLMMVCAYPATIGTFSRGAWVALGVVTVVLVLKSKHRFLIAGVGSVLLMIGASLFPLFASERLSVRAQTFENIQEDGSAQQRFGSWEFCTRVGLANPIFGLGFDYYSLAVYKDYYPEYVERWGLERWNGRAWSCHSMWFTVLGEHGVLVFVLWISLLVSCFLKLQSLKAIAQKRPDLAWYVHWADALQASLLGFVVAGTFLDVAYFDVYYQLIVIAIILKERQIEELTQSTAGTPHAFPWHTRSEERKGEGANHSGLKPAW